MDRLHQALIFMENHLGEPLTLEQIAASADLSPYHFSRFFRRVRGESVMSHLRRRRLTRAANRLRLENTRILDLALDCGFESQAAFHRAFKRAFGVSPGAFRRDDTWVSALMPCCSDLNEEDHKMTVFAEPRIEDCPERRLVGLDMAIARGGQAEIPGLWRRFRTAYETIEDKIAGVYYGVCHDHDRKSGNFSYLAAVEVRSPRELDEELSELVIPAGRFAIFTHEIVNPNLGIDLPKTFRHIFGTWLPASDYVLGDGPDFERYDERFDSTTMSGEIDIYIPLQSKT